MCVNAAIRLVLGSKVKCVITLLGFQGQNVRQNAILSFVKNLSTQIQNIRSWRGSNPRPSACKADVITTTPHDLYNVNKVPDDFVSTK